ncbi:glycosyltransferase [Marinobacter nauticus]|uniref:glycosyltransferase n=1 Tax=Marinobacter nauticus TaxID=2743 RepID=UPI001CFC5967|nr:glycosyltransferase [Marinobacter nauticus]
MKILVIAANFPSTSKPHNGIFVKNLLLEFVRLGHEVVVVSPQKIIGESLPKEVIENGYKVYRPKFMSFGNKDIVGLKTRLLSNLSFKLAVYFFVLRKQLYFDAIYSHFLFPSGATAVKLSKRSGRPAFCSLGESTFEAYEEVYSRKRIRKLLDSFSVVFPNSLDKTEFLARTYGEGLKMRYVPNGVNTDVFFAASQTDARKKLGLSQTAKIVLFVGGFIDRKGPLRVLAACERLHDVPDMVFIGEGPQRLEHPNIVFCGKAEQKELQLYLNAADVFVTPSRREGMPNALLEAMACSCRIVASDIPVHRELLEGYSPGILCDGEDPKSLSGAIQQMLACCHPSTPGEFKYSLKERAQAVLRGIETVL